MKNRAEKEDDNIEYEKNESDYIIYDDFITLNHYIGRKNDDVKLRWRKKRSHIIPFKYFILYKKGHKLNNRNSESWNVDIHRASFAKHLRSKNHLEKGKQNDMFIPQWLFKKPIENQI